MSRILALVVGFVLVFGSAARADLAAAMDELRSGNWEGAFDAAGASGSSAYDIIEWHWLRAGRGDANSALAFVERHADWPGLSLLRRKSEGAFLTAAPGQVLAFFETEEPQTPDGVLTYVNALRAAGRDGEAEATLVLAWHTMPMGAKTQNDFLKAGGALLTPHHWSRLDSLLWEGHQLSARRMLTLVSDGQRALALARLALQDQAAGVDTLIENVTDSLSDDPGLAYDRFAWRVRKDRDDDALALLLSQSRAGDALGIPEKWASRRRIYTRSLMRAGDYQKAYDVAARHGLSDGSAFADLEWLSGFLKLRFLDDPETAVAHFQRFNTAVRSPISKGRGGYWLGRAFEAAGDPVSAQVAYGEGALYQTSFYGLLAAERGNILFDPDLANPPEIPPWRDAPFTGSSVFAAGLALLNAGEAQLAERFFTHLVEGLDGVEAEQLGQMAVDLGNPHLAVMIAKRAARGGQILNGSYYPLHPMVDMGLPMATEMSLAIARRESEFDPAVVSGAGAQGLMQVMPATGRLVARDLGVEGAHTTQRMLADWRYNAQLGATYLAGLAGEFNGNVVMMSAGYNAGPGRPRQWMERFGDPRTDGIDIVDWIEMIPFTETRNYVMRVTESLPVYRARLGQDPLPVRFSDELRGSTLRSFAP